MFVYRAEERIVAHLPPSGSYGLIGNAASLPFPPGPPHQGPLSLKPADTLEQG